MDGSDMFAFRAFDTLDRYLYGFGKSKIRDGYPKCPENITAKTHGRCKFLLQRSVSFGLGLSLFLSRILLQLRLRFQTECPDLCL